MNKILLATTNHNKVIEVRKLLAHLNYDIVSYSDFNISPDVIENGFTFKENAYIKALYGYNLLHLPTIADDSGICIKHFLNLPGIHSARFLNKYNTNEKNSFIIDVMKNVKEREAKYVCALVLLDEVGSHLFLDEVIGEISLKLAGNSGFGYDPLFYLPQLGKTFAELSLAEKNKLSHRGKALRKLVNYLEEKNSFNH